MNCDEVRLWIDAYVDRELDLATSITVEKHLESCAKCKNAYTGRESLRSAVRENLRYAAPVALRERLASGLREEEEKTQPQSMTASRPFWFQPVGWMPWAVAAMLVLVVLASTALLRGRQQQELLAQEMVAAHVRSLQPNHLMDVISTDQHTVKPWFTGRIDFSPVVVDLASDGFPLVGGRLDYVEGHNAAALIYQRRKHTINVFIWPGDATFLRNQLSRQGYNLLLWRDAGLNYCAVSDVNVDDLKQLAGRLQAAH